MESQLNPGQESLPRRAMGDLVLAELFLIQATLESASVIRDGISDLGRQLGSGEEAPSQSVSRVLQRTRDEVVDSYSARFRYLRELLAKDSRG